MTKKDYVLIAEALKRARDTYPDLSKMGYNIASEIADALERDNPRFDRHRFLDASRYLTLAEHNEYMSE